jgi:hypothetical protein
LMETDWLKLWHELVLAGSSAPNSELVSRYKAHACRRSERLAQLLDLILKRIGGENTVLDIGAGNGRLSKMSKPSPFGYGNYTPVVNCPQEIPLLDGCLRVTRTDCTILGIV